MNRSIEQAQVFVIFLLAGFVIGILFDCFRISRKVIKTPDFVTALEDGTFWILTGIFITYMIFVFHNGEIRLFLILATFLGISIYYLTISKFFMKYTIAFIQLLIKFLVKPILKMLYFLLKPLKILVSFFKKKIIFCLIKIKNQKKMLKEKTKKKKFTIFSKKAAKKEGIL